MRLFALRGATTVAADDAKQILAATDELMRELMSRNDLTAESMVSCIFTLTPDLNATFPAQAAREMGLSSVPLLCARELDVPDAMPRVIRTMIHYYAADEHRPQHVYLGEAAKLRLDLEGAQ